MILSHPPAPDDVLHCAAQLERRRRALEFGGWQLLVGLGVAAHLQLLSTRFVHYCGTMRKPLGDISPTTSPPNRHSSTLYLLLSGHSEGKTTEGKTTKKSATFLTASNAAAWSKNAQNLTSELLVTTPEVVCTTQAQHDPTRNAERRHS